MPEIPRSPILGSSHQRTPRGDRQTYFPSAPPLTSSRPDTGLEDLGEGIAALGQSLGGLAIQGLKREKALEQAAIQSEARDLTQEFMSFYSDEIIEFDRAKNFDDATAEGWAVGVMEKFDAGIEDLFEGRSPEAIDLVALDIGRQRNKLKEKAFIHSAEQRGLKQQSAFTDVVDTLAVSVAADIQSAAEAMDDLGETIEQFPEGQRDEIKRSVAERLYKAEGMKRLHENNPAALIEWLKRPDVAAALDKPEELLLKALEQKNKIEAAKTKEEKARLKEEKKAYEKKRKTEADNLRELAESQFKENEAELKSDITNFNDLIASAQDRLIKDNVTVPEGQFDKWKQDLVGMANFASEGLYIDEGNRLPDSETELSRVSELDTYLRVISGYTTEELNQEVTSLNKGIERLEQVEYDSNRKKADLISNWVERVDKDPYGALVQTGKIDHIPLDLSSVDSLKETFGMRAQAFARGKDQWGRLIPVVTKEEVGELQDYWNQADANGRMSLLEGIVKSEAPAAQIAATFEALSPEGVDADMLEYTSVRLLAGDKAAAETVLKGLDILRNPAGAGRASIRGAEYEGKKVTAYEAMGYNYLPTPLRNTVSRAVDAIYVVNRMNAEGEKEDKGDPTSVNTDVLDEAMAQVLGEIVKVNDYATAIPRGSTAKDVQGFAKNLTLAKMKEFSVVHDATPVFIDATTGQPALMDPEMKVDSSTFGFSIQGRERFHFVPWNFNGVYFVLYTDRDGNVSPLYVGNQGNREFLINLGDGVRNYKAGRIKEQLSNLESAVPADTPED